ncbi:hypothetical protein MBLNU230_g5050t1 [Neophaeotheca triangularis]
MDDPKITHNKSDSIVNPSIATESPDYRLDPAQYLRPNPDPSNQTSALIILNSPLNDYDLLSRLHSHSIQTICADGGANRLHDLLTSKFPQLPPSTALQKLLPHHIHGDLDSLKPTVRELYTNLNIPVTQDHDQYSTDFGKAITLALHQRSPPVTDVLVLGSLSGRVDQGLGLLHELYREQVHRHPGTRFWLFTESNVSVLLNVGVTCLVTDMREGLLGRSVGVLPVFGKAVVSTGGLEWDVSEWETEMGRQVSTSNRVVGGEVWVRTEREVLFTVETVVEGERGESEV